MLAVHLAVDGVQRLLSAHDAHAHAVLREGGLDLALHARDQVLAARARLVQCLGQHFVAPGVEEAERQVLQFAVGEVQAQAVGDGGVDLQRFAADALPLAARHVAHGAHVVGAVRQLDQDHPHVLGHRQQHLAEALGLVLLAGVELEFLQFGQSVDQFGHRGAEALHQIGLGDAAILDHVVHEGGHQGLRIELPLGALGRHRDRVGDVRVAVLAHLAQVRFIGQAVGLADVLDVAGGQVVEFAQQGCKAGRGGTGRSRCRLGRSGGSGRNGIHPATVAREAPGVR